MRLLLSASKLPKPATFDLIEVRQLVYSCRNPGRACWHQPRLLGGQVCQDLDIGDGIGKREPVTAPYLERPQHFQLFAIGFRKTELPLTDPDVCDLEVVRDASNEFIHGWLVVQAGREPRKISPPHNTAIEQAGKTLSFFAQGVAPKPRSRWWQRCESGVRRRTSSDNPGSSPSSRRRRYRYSNMDTTLFVIPSTSRRGGRRTRDTGIWQDRDTRRSAL
jgi:hypothetical protein